MAIAIIAEVPGRDAKFDDEMVQRLNLSADPAPGALVRLAGPVEGGWRVVSIWESEDAWNKFRSERLEPALRAAGQEPPKIEIWPLHALQINR